MTDSTMQVIADLYEKYVELIGQPQEDGETMSDGYVRQYNTGRWQKHDISTDTDVANAQ